jgi:hypothetical protein
MTWAAYFQANSEHRYTIAVTRYQHTADYEAEKFISRMKSGYGSSGLMRLIRRNR